MDKGQDERDISRDSGETGMAESEELSFMSLRIMCCLFFIPPTPKTALSP